MPKKQNRTSNQTTIRVGDIAGVSGTVNIAGGDVNIQQNTGLSAAELGQLFDRINAAVDSRLDTSPANRADLKSEVNEIQSTISEAAQKSGKVDEDFLARRFRNIARMAPDILEVVVATLANPLMGLGVTASKIRDRALQETRGT